MTFTKWLETFVSEKGLDTEHVFEVEGASGVNFIPLECVIEAAFKAPTHEQSAIKGMLVRIDFLNGEALKYFAHLAQALAV